MIKLSSLEIFFFLTFVNLTLKVFNMEQLKPLAGGGYPAFFFILMRLMWGLITFKLFMERKKMNVHLNIPIAFKHPTQWLKTRDLALKSSAQVKWKSRASKKFWRRSSLGMRINHGSSKSYRIQIEFFKGFILFSFSRACY